MNCAEFEQLIDACLDGELSGSLRLEFDAHRLRCRRCQLTMVMMESVEHVVMTDRQTPALADDFTSRVMKAVDRRKPLGVRYRPIRVAIVGGALLQAAAVLLLALLLPGRAEIDPGPTPGASIAPTKLAEQLDRQYAEVDQKSARAEALYDEIVKRCLAAGLNLDADVTNAMRAPLAWSLPADMAGMSERAAEHTPGLILQMLTGARPEPAEAAPAAADQHSL